MPVKIPIPADIDPDQPEKLEDESDADWDHNGETVERNASGRTKASSTLDELEAEELEMLTEDEVSETLPVDEAEELRALRRAQLSLTDDGAGEREADEFQCQHCFLVLKTSQLIGRRKKFCRDCAE